MALPSLYSQFAVKTLEEDLLGLNASVQALAAVLGRFKDGAVVAVSGEWGQGKTSFLQMLQRHMVDTGMAPDTAWIPLWEYEGLSDVLYSFTRDVANETMTTADRVGRRVRVYRQDAFGALFSLIRTVKVKFGAGDGTGVEVGGVSSGDLQELADKIRRENLLAYEEDEVLRQKAKDYLQVSSGKHPIVFVDDLDRCDPTTALSILESLKLLFAGSRCRFVLAVDLDIIREAVAARYLRERFREPDQQARSYVDKLVDLSVPLPSLTVASANEFIDSLLNVANYQGGEIPLELSGAERLTILAGAPLNPRAIKRLLLTLSYEKARSSMLTDDGVLRKNGSRFEQHLELARCVKRLILELYYPPMVRMARNFPSDFSKLQAAKDFDLSEWETACSDAGRIVSMAERVRNSAGAAWPEAAEQCVANSKGLEAWVRTYAPHLIAFLARTPAVESLPKQNRDTT